VPFLPRVSFDSVQALAKQHLLPKKLHPAHESLSPMHKDRLLRAPEQPEFLFGVQNVKDVLILICGHGGRDMRCGVTGPILKNDFEKCLPSKGINLLAGPVEICEEAERVPLPVIGTVEANKTARVGLISHIGGHKFAGNVIVYIPPGMTTESGNSHALAGCGIWYGRVEPKHIEGIVQETILSGKVIEDLFRGGINQGGDILRL
jgi:(2Fe-2S) ferredoxin